jgi:hypothetical protein
MRPQGGDAGPEGGKADVMMALEPPGSEACGAGVAERGEIFRGDSSTGPTGGPHKRGVNGREEERP